MTIDGRLYDPGLQPERTALAWRRTCLTLAVSALAGTRVLPAIGGAWTLLTGVAAVIAMLIVVLAERRYRRVSRELTEHGDAAIGGGALPLLVAVSTVALGVVSVAVLHTPS